MLRYFIVVRILLLAAITSLFPPLMCVAQNTSWQFESPNNLPENSSTPDYFQQNIYYKTSSKVSGNVNGNEVALTFALTYFEPDDDFGILVSLESPSLHIRNPELILIEDRDTTGLEVKAASICSWDHLEKATKALSIGNIIYENKCMSVEMRHDPFGREGTKYYSNLRIGLNNNITDVLLSLKTGKQLDVTLSTSDSFQSNLEKTTTFTFNLADSSAPLAFTEFEQATLKTDSGGTETSIDDIVLSKEEVVILEAAHNGDINAQFMFAKTLYRSNRDEALGIARGWLNSAASQGHAAALEELGMMYYTAGLGEPRDLALSYATLSLAEMGGEPVSKESFKRLLKEMNSAEMSRAQTFIQNCIKQGLDICMFETE